MQLKCPSAPFERLEAQGGELSLDIEGDVLVAPTGNGDLLPLYNEYTNKSNRCSVVETPFGGMKGSGAPDYCPGTLNLINSDGIYLTDINGNNSSKTLTAGKLSELGHLTVDKTNHTITEEFVIRNDGAGSDVRVIDSCDSANGWGTYLGSGHAISVDTNDKATGTGSIKVIGTSSNVNNGQFAVLKQFGSNLNGYTFIRFSIKSTKAGNLCFGISDTSSSRIKWWVTNAKFFIRANVWTTFTLPLLAPISNAGGNPTDISGNWTINDTTRLFIGVFNVGVSQPIEIHIDDITTCKGTWTKVEVAVPDVMKPLTSLSNDLGFRIFVWDGTQYQPGLRTTSTAVYWNSDTSKFLDGTKFKDTMGYTDPYDLIASQYHIGVRESVRNIATDGVTCTTPSTFTYSSNYGTSKRIGFAILMPPSDNGRTGINQCRLKLVTYYDKGTDGNYSSTYEFAPDDNCSNGLRNQNVPWIALMNTTAKRVDFFLAPGGINSLKFKKNEAGMIYKLELSSGNGDIYHGRADHPNLSRDTDSDGIPDVLDYKITGSIFQCLKTHGRLLGL